MKKNKTQENFLDKVPVRNDRIDWQQDENGIVTLLIENKGLFNRIAQKLFRKPKITQIHLDENGSFIWPLIDGIKTVAELGEPVKQHFGEAAEPLYPRLAKFIQILNSYGFVGFK